jgi:hypothetical protein
MTRSAAIGELCAFFALSSGERCCVLKAPQNSALESLNVCSQTVDVTSGGGGTGFFVLQ